ncbi:histidine kinase [Xenophilus arseniciresistens]|uniref:Histidine kinase n=1 Tax=Xenophilus arseniciresistens TaxID=1283306 RepID=A0AAE3N4W0_9BURK|nr:histidine kinase [Xenophilus arseniciresistens]MDA7415261.1 histidine kinase [Xenophilus arseniciresistens]
MAQSVLGSLALHYRALWSRRRQLAGLQLFAHEESPGADGGHLLRTVSELWSAQSPHLLLSPATPSLLESVLAHADAQSPQIDVPAAWLRRGGITAAVRRAHERGASMLVSGDAASLQALAGATGLFTHVCVVLGEQDAAQALRVAMQLREDVARGRFGTRPDSPSPVTAGSLVAGAAGTALVQHALDQQGAWAVAGWPTEDVLHGMRARTLHPGRRAILRVMNALDRELPLEAIEHALARDATLAYRLLSYLNSAGLGLRGGVASLRHGVMMMGHRPLNGWLAEQLTTAADDRDLDPIHVALGLRAALAAELMDAGLEQELQSEVFLTAMFSQLDLLQSQPLRTLLARIPLPERMPDALLRGTGPYAGVLQLARALEGEQPAALRQARETAGVGLEECNRALLRVLAQASD